MATQTPPSFADLAALRHEIYLQSLRSPDLFRRPFREPRQRHDPRAPRSRHRAARVGCVGPNKLYHLSSRLHSLARGTRALRTRRSGSDVPRRFRRSWGSMPPPNWGGFSFLSKGMSMLWVWMGAGDWSMEGLRGASYPSRSGSGSGSSSSSRWSLGRWRMGCVGGRRDVRIGWKGTSDPRGRHYPQCQLSQKRMGS
jgi:hypothetical protein